MKKPSLKVIGVRSLPPKMVNQFKSQERKKENLKRMIRGLQEEIEFEKTQEALGGKNETNDGN
ncbi:MAG: hypothetical protein FWE31_04810 [Firmicutes bacterium]|nr:hypothetical protein [Bacillota bacterium]